MSDEEKPSGYAEPDQEGEYQLVHAFGIDEGELDDLTPQQVFVLGVEYGNALSWVNHGDWSYCYRAQIHSENLERFRALADGAGVAFMSEVVHDGWVRVEMHRRNA